MRCWQAFALDLGVALSAAVPAVAQTAASVEPLAGRVEYRLVEDTEFRALPKAIYLPATAYVRTGDDGLVAIRYADDTHITVKAGSLVRVGGVEESLRSTTLLTGGLRHSCDWIDEGTGRRDAERVNGDGQVGQHVSLLPLGGLGIAVLYDETLRVKALRLGSGVGLTPTHELVIGADAVAGFSQEEAKQRLPAGGGVREDGDDRLVALNLHLGVQHFVRSGDATLPLSHNLLLVTSMP